MIKVDDLSFSYRNSAVFDGLSFTLEDHPVTALLGLNGEGKTTFIKLLLGLLKPDKGSILVDGCEIGSLSDRERSRLLSYVPQDNDGSVKMSVSDFICMGGIDRQDLFKGPDGNDRRIAEDILKDLDASGFSNKGLETLSHGQRRLVYLARAIFQDSAIMVLDEPVSSLDLTRQHGFLRLLRKHAQNNDKRVIMSMHDPSLAYEYADAFVFFKDGRCFDVLYKEDPSFRKRLSENISLLYENRIRTEYIDDRLFMKYDPGKSSR